MATNEKGLNRGGVGGQEGELGDDSKNLDRDRDTTQGPLDPGGSRQRNMNQQRGGLRREPDLEGGLRREPDLEGAEKKTGHEVD